MDFSKIVLPSSLAPKKDEDTSTVDGELVEEKRSTSEETLENDFSESSEEVQRESFEDDPQSWNDDDYIDLDKASRLGDPRELRNPFLEDDDEFQPFLGLNATPGEMQRTIGIEEKRNSVNSFFEDFLEDDEEVFAPTDSFVGEVDNSDKDSDGGSDLGSVWEDFKNRKPRNKSSDFLPEDHDGEKRRRQGQAARSRTIGSQNYRDRTVEKIEKPVNTKSKKARLESEFGPAVKEIPVIIGPDGRDSKVSDDQKKRRSDAQRLREFYKNSAFDAPVSYTYLRQNGKLNVAELEFFRNMQTSKKKAQMKDSSASEIWKPASSSETEREREKRLRLQTRAIEGSDSDIRGSVRRFNDKEKEIIDFLAKFRYAKAMDFARMFGTMENTELARLKKLRSMGLVVERRVYGTKPIWFLTIAGMMVSGFDLPRLTERTLTYSMFNHQFVVNHVAANLRGGKTNVLNLEDFPLRNRSNLRGEKLFGENLVSELQIQSSLGKLRTDGKAVEYKPGLIRKIDNALREWNSAGGVSSGLSSPEMVAGNEWMWPLYPSEMLKLAWHIPDLVVVRDRNPDGSPESIAVEIEINTKPLESYERTLRAYKLEKKMFKKVIWVCKAEYPARRLETVAKEIGLWQEGRIDIVPIISEEGIITGRDLWMI